MSAVERQPDSQELVFFEGNNFIGPKLLSFSNDADKNSENSSNNIIPISSSEAKPENSISEFETLVVIEDEGVVPTSLQNDFHPQKASELNEGSSHRDNVEIPLEENEEVILADPRPNVFKKRPAASHYPQIVTKQDAINHIDDYMQQMWDKYSWELLKFAYSKVGNLQDSEDLVNSVFLEVLHVPEKRLPEDLNYTKLHLVTLTNSRSIDLIRAKKSRPQAVDFDSGFDDDYRMENAINQGVDVNPIEDYIIQHERASELHDAIKRLPDLQKTAIYMTLQGHTQAEIAEVLNVPLGTIKTRIRLAYVKLKGMIQSNTPDGLQPAD